MHTAFCTLVGVSVPIVQGPLGGPWPPSVRLAAAVSEAGAVGSLPTALRSPAQVREDIAVLRDLTDRPYALNHTMKPFDEDVFAEVLRAAPPVVSFALGFRPELIARAHGAGSLFVQQIHDPAQAAQAVEAGADVIVAQGDEAGGFGGGASSMVLVPQVVAQVAPVPVLAAGGIVDGRGLAAAMALGAQGATVGTRFIASEEAELGQGYKEAVLAAGPASTVRAPFVNELVPPASEGAYATAPRVVRNPFIDEWLGREEDVGSHRDELAGLLRAAAAAGRVHEVLVVAGQAAGSIDDVRPAAEIVHRMATEAEEVLRALASTAS